MYHHRAFGLTIASPLHLPAPECGSDLPVDLTIAIDTALPPPEEGEARRISPLMQIAVGHADRWILYANGFDPTQRYTASIGHREVVVGWTEGVEPHDLARHLVGPVLAAHAFRTGKICLHGCAIRTASGAALILGESGRGKSTLTAALVAAGAALIAEEYLILPGGCLSVLPGVPAFKVAESTAALLGLADRARPTFVHPDYRSEGVTVELPGDAFADGAPVPIAAVYLLDRRHSEPVPRLSPRLPGAAAATALAPHGYWAPHLPPDVRATLLRRVLDIVQTCPVRRLALPDDLTALPAAVALFDAVPAKAPA